MKKLLSYSTKYIESALKYRESAEHGIDLKEMLYQRLTCYYRQKRIVNKMLLIDIDGGHYEFSEINLCRRN